MKPAINIGGQFPQVEEGIKIEKRFTTQGGLDLTPSPEGNLALNIETIGANLNALSSLIADEYDFDVKRFVLDISHFSKTDAEPIAYLNIEVAVSEALMAQGIMNEDIRNLIAQIYRGELNLLEDEEAAA